MHVMPFDNTDESIGVPLIKKPIGKSNDYASSSLVDPLKKLQVGQGQKYVSTEPQDTSLHCWGFIVLICATISILPPQGMCYDNDSNCFCWLFCARYMPFHVVQVI